MNSSSERPAVGKIPGDQTDGAVGLDPATRKAARRMADDLLALLAASPSAYHAVEQLGRRLRAAGFAPLDERAPFEMEAGGRYLITRQDTSLIALVAGSAPPSAGGFRLLGAHTDSPALKLKPRPEIEAEGEITLGIEVYGGPLLATWADRDLGLCGRALVLADDGKLESRLFSTGRPVAVIPNAAIHMNRGVNEAGLKLNPQTEMTPLLGSIAGGLPREQAIRRLLAELLAISAEQIIDFDALLYDTQAPALTGWNEEYISGGHLDDLAMCYAGLQAMLDTMEQETAATRLLVCVDSEEVGSQTAQGARSNFLPQVLERTALARGDDRQGYFSALAASRLVSADNAHARHPGYVEKSEPRHAPRLNGGPVLKVHASRAYATDGYAAAFFELACRRAGVPCQRFVNRSDAKSGGTIGSMTAAQLGVPTADVGCAQYAMHSIREMGGALDPWYMRRAMAAFLQEG
jgi:aspartyl aminopeptidase